MAQASAPTSGGGEPRKPGGSLPAPDLRKGPKHFLQGVVREMKKVNWPSPQETTRLTGVVLAVCAATIVFLVALNFLFQTVISVLVGVK